MRRRGLGLGVAVFVGILGGAAPAWASGSYYVSAGGSDANTCTSEAAPCASISQALTEATGAGDNNPTIYVSGTIDISTDAGDVNGVAIGTGVSPTITQDPLGSAAEISHGSGTGTSLFNVGGSGSLTVTGLELDGLSSTPGGSINDQSTGTVTVVDDTFVGGSTANGGAIADQGGGDLTVTGDTFDHVGAGNGVAGVGFGGAIWVQNGNHLSVSGSTFESDSSNVDGGAIAIVDAATTAVVTNSTFTGATAGANGGAIAVDGASTLTVSGSTFYRNVATTDGGAVYLGSTSAATTITSSTFDGNTGNNVGFLASTNPSTSGNNLYDATGAAAPQIAADLFYGTCALNVQPVDAGYDAAYDGSCLATSPAASDRVSASVGDVSALETESGATAGTPQTVVVGAANPAAGRIAASTSVLAGTVTLCPITDEAGVASSGACNAGASQATPTPRPVLYVGHGGTDTGDCTNSAAQCQTLSYALVQQNKYSDPTVYLSGDISEDGIGISEDVTIAQWSSGASASIDGAGLSASTPLLEITGGTVVVNGITIDNAPGAGAVLVDDPGNTVTFDGDTFSANANTTSGQGGAIADTAAGTVDVSQTTFTGNSSSSSAGAIWVGDGGTANVTGSSFTGDTSNYGGAIAVAMGDSPSGDTLNVTNSQFTNEQAHNEGGAIDNADGSTESGTVAITGSTFSSDDAPFGGAVANGLNAGAGNLTVASTVFANDGSTSGGSSFGGALLNGYGSGSTGTADVTDSSFYSDHTTDDGGAIDNAESGATGTLTIVGSTFDGDGTEMSGTGSTGGNGGAIDNGDPWVGGAGTGTLKVFDSTFSNATIHITGTGQLINNGSGSSATVAGDIFDGTCAQGTAWTDDDYNVGLDATCTNAGAHDVTAASSSALDLGSPDPTYFTLEPTFASPAVGLIPSGTTAGATTLCPLTDIFGDAGPTFGNGCNAGAVQAYVPVPPAAGAYPTNITASSSSPGDASVSWTAPSLAAAGGEITGYTVTPHDVTANTNGSPVTTANTSTSFSNLNQGDTYTFAVVTSNSKGSSGPGTSNSIQIQPVSTGGGGNTNTGTTTTPTTTTPTTTTATTTTPTTTTKTATTPAPPPPAPTTQKVTVTIDNQALTLTTPIVPRCLATSKKTVTVGLSSTTIARSTAPRLRFVQALLTLDGRQSQTERGASSHVSFRLTGLTRGLHTVKAAVFYRMSIGHHKTQVVLKTVSARIKVC